MDVFTEQLKELETHKQISPHRKYGEIAGVSVSVIADLLGVEYRDMLNAMDKSVPVFNGKGYGTDSHIYKKPSGALWGHVGWWSLKEQKEKLRHCILPEWAKFNKKIKKEMGRGGNSLFVIGYFGRTLTADNLTRHIFNGEEYELSPQGSLIHTHPYVDLEQHKEWLTLFEGKGDD